MFPSRKNLPSPDPFPPCRLEPVGQLVRGTGKNVLFISDIHLHPWYSERTAQLAEFLRRNRNSVETLVCLGDLFDFWLGYDTVVPAFTVPVLAELEAYVRDGVQFIFLTGNHDVSLGAYFTERLGAIVHDEPVVYWLGGQRILLGHGDEFDRNLGYQIVRRLMRTPCLQRFARLIPPDLAWRGAHRLSKSSKNLHKTHPRPDRLGLYEDHLLRRYAEAGVDIVLTGHLHHPFDREFSWAGRTVRFMNNGDFIEHFTASLHSPAEGLRIIRDGPAQE